MSVKEKKIIVYSVDTKNYEIRIETHLGREHIVVPVVMMVEGVHSGSRGPLFHSAEELGSVVAAWNGIPITVQHPQQNGIFVSANSPSQIDSSVGRAYNAHMEGDKLKAEAWLDVQKLAAISPVAAEYIKEKRPLDVSVGVFTLEEEEEGEWNGEHYTAIARNHRPDHLALLPGVEGACNWADGCGIRVNSKYKTNANEMKDEKPFQIYKDLNKKGLAVVPVVNMSGYVELSNKVRSKLDSMDNEMSMYFLEELYEDKLIYRIRNHAQDTTTLYQQTYSVGDDGKVELTGDAREVRKNITYETNKRRTTFNNNSKTKDMDKQVEARVEALIANSNAKWNNCDREFLSGLSLARLEELEKATVKIEQPKLDANAAIQFLKDNHQKDEDLLSLLSKEAQEAYQTGLKLYQEKRKEYIGAIVANTKQWKEDELEGMDFALLEKFAKSFPKKDVDQPVDYSGQGSAPLNLNKGDDDFLPPTSAYASKGEKK